MYKLLFFNFFFIFGYAGSSLLCGLSLAEEIGGYSVGGQSEVLRPWQRS